MIKKGMCRQNHYKWLLRYKEKDNKAIESHEKSLNLWELSQYNNNMLDNILSNYFYIFGFHLGWAKNLLNEFLCLKLSKLLIYLYWSAKILKTFEKNLKQKNNYRIQYILEFYLTPNIFHV
jgi:hypothetical protein